MLKTYVLVMILAACSVHCNVTSTSIGEELPQASLDVTTNIISKEKYPFYLGSNSTTNKLQKPADCLDILQMGRNKSGVYTIWPVNRLTAGKSLHVYCDMDTNGGGWTVIQRRGDFGSPEDYFYQNWDTYKNGFGDIEKDFWLGNDNIFALTHQNLYSVRFDLEDEYHNRRYAVYDMFWIDDEYHKYTLHISGYYGNAGDSMDYHNNHPFTTLDRDNDRVWCCNCAILCRGGWWYNHCHNANLNGLNFKGRFRHREHDGKSWYKWKGQDESLGDIEIKIRPKHFRPGANKK